MCLELPLDKYYPMLYTHVMKLKNIITVPEFVKRYGVDRKTVIDWIKKGKLEAYQIVEGGRWYINILSIPTFMREGENK